MGSLLYYFDSVKKVRIQHKCELSCVHLIVCLFFSHAYGIVAKFVNTLLRFS